ncbi:thyrotroph embryonic factor-like [Physella acuta]|uniref:thyrotroph embryonic factor-like n=1 Tax=Physella acuta TaxID=109671 RepID=UPI0027DB843C|nr:thyrotroph embryonic factor-like [Physella acuta]
MSDGVLDLSVSSYGVAAKRTLQPFEHFSSDSGRASSDSTSSETHEDVKPRIRASPLTMAAPSPVNPPYDTSSYATGPVAFPTSHLRDLPHMAHMLRPASSSASPPHPANPVTMAAMSSLNSNPNSPNQATSLMSDDPSKQTLTDRTADSRLAAMRQFKMFPMDPFNMYNNPLMSTPAGTLSPTPAALQSLYDTVSPSGFPNYPLTPLTSHLLQRKRRNDNRDNPGSSSTTPSKPPSTAMADGNGSSGVSTSSPQSPRDEDSNGSDGEKRKKSGSSIDVKKDEAYWDRRRKNNEAAKRSRDARRQKEEEIAMRAAFLEQENLKLRAQVAILKNETAKLHYMLYNRL